MSRFLSKLCRARGRVNGAHAAPASGCGTSSGLWWRSREERPRRMKWALRSRTQSRIASARSLSWSTWPSAASGLLVAQDLARGVKPPGTGAPGLTASGAAHRGAQAHGQSGHARGRPLGPTQGDARDAVARLGSARDPQGPEEPRAAAEAAGAPAKLARELKDYLYAVSTGTPPKCPSFERSRAGPFAGGPGHEAPRPRAATPLGGQRPRGIARRGGLPANCWRSQPDGRHSAEASTNVRTPLPVESTDRQGACGRGQGEHGVLSHRAKVAGRATRASSPYRSDGP